ncbi:MAG: nucleotidyltransferase family protein [Clostridiales bacterium]|nr:nucleotidyltransferase family protein [Clostridiales bacterium]
MTAARRFFISLLTDLVHGQAKAKFDPDIDWDELYSIAEDHTLAGALYLPLRALSEKGEAIPEEALQRFHSAFHCEIYFSVNREKMLGEALGAFEKAGARAVPFKGWLLREYWPVPEVRHMSDIDLVIDHKDRKVTDDVMMELGYTRGEGNHAVWVYSEKDVMFELHDHMFYDRLSNDVDYIGYFDKVWDRSEAGIDPGSHMVYTIAHMAKHITNQGIGFRAFLDLVFISRDPENGIDWKWLEGELKKLELWDFTRICFSLCRRWFDVILPVPFVHLSKEFFDSTTEKMFNDGMFGLENRQNAAAGTAKAIRRSGGYVKGAIRLMIGRLFPRYRDMQLTPQYKFVDGRPWLLPAAWVYRWGYCIKHKRSDSMELLSEPVKKRREVEEREKLLSDWGL